MVSVGVTDLEEDSYYTWPYSYILCQSKAIAEAERQELDSSNGISVSFNEKGNVSQARTIDIDGHEIVIELGGGRLVFK